MPTAKATVNGTLLAETSTWEEVEGNIYVRDTTPLSPRSPYHISLINNAQFPPSAIKKNFFVESDLTTFCGWKGDAKYYSIVDGDVTVENAAWYYPEPFDKAEYIQDFVAFYPNKVTVTVE
ncbi:hypothetical protein BBP40_000797 [Aspergillus hancockii]|nr:hypothetical protein BBP40_000797 [Aspergillus hancockii]